MTGWLGSYETVKYVNIQDARLGALRLILLIGIVSYVVIVEMLQLGGYLESNPIVGTVRFSLQQPTKDNCDPTKSRAENYDDGDHNNDNNGCTNAFVPLNELEYCQQSKTKTNDDNYTATTTTTTSSNHNYAGNVYPCEIYEAVNAQVLRETSLVIWTRATTYNQTLVCDGSMESGDTVCPRTYENNANDDENNNLYTAASHTTSTTTTNQQPQPNPFYIAQSEAFTVLLEHAATASKICEYHNHHQHGRRKKKKRNKNKQQQQHYACSAQAEEHPGGRLYSTNRQLCQKESLKNNSFVMPTGSKLYSSLSSSTNDDETAAGCYIGANQTTSRKQDFFSLDVLLQAAGISLDDCIPSSFDIDNSHSNKNNIDKNNNNTTCTTYRESGATLLLSIVWNDFQPFYGLVEPFYYYSPSLIGTSSYKESIPFYYNTYRSSRILLRGHGIKIAVLMTGNFHQFQALRFLITLTTALGMLAVATTVVDSLMLYVLPEKERYQRVKYEQVRVGQVVVGVGDGDGAVVTAAEEEDGESPQQLVPSEMTASEERSSSPGWWWWWLWPMRDQQPVSPNSQHVMETTNRDITTVATTTRPNDPLPAAAVTTAGQELDGDTTRDSTSSGYYQEVEENVLDIVGDHNHNNINNDAPPPQPQSSENNDLTEPLLPLVERRQAMLNRHPSS